VALVDEIKAMEAGLASAPESEQPSAEVDHE
jgi:hypothetical protein